MEWLAWNRRKFVFALGAGAIAAPLVSYPQSAQKIARIGVLRAGQPPKNWINGFERGLTDLGYVDGKNIALDYRFTDGSTQSLPRIAEELARLNPAVIVALGSQAALAAHAASRALPVVFVGVDDPVDLGMVASLGRPGGNITGLAITSADLNGKRLELLKELVPGLKRVAVLGRRASRSHRNQVNGTIAAARSMRIQIQALSISGPEDLESAFGAARGADGLIVLNDPLFASLSTRVAALAAAKRLPAIYGFSVLVESGGLMSYGADLGELYGRAATFVHKILKGANAGDLPVEQPTKFEILVNLKAAKALGLKIPQSILLRADRVIE